MSGLEDARTFVARVAQKKLTEDVIKALELDENRGMLEHEIENAYRRVVRLGHKQPSSKVG